MTKTDPRTEELRTEAPLVPDLRRRERPDTDELRFELAAIRSRLDSIERAMQPDTEDI
ncbi:hypothetical protein [Halobaculum sp. D14]|uniref:hypothetical protein n=1 Tax=Halobaculum sp. D14 TaxID=3421642 RepID=UPI003EC10A49